MRGTVWPATRTREDDAKDGEPGLREQQPALIGQYGVDMAVAALEGGQVTPKVQTGFTIVTKDNVDGDGASAVYKSTC